MAQRGMTPFNVSLAANVPQSFNVEGDYVHFLTAPLASGVKVRFDEGKQATYYEGVGLRTYYARIELESIADQDIVVLLGFGHVFDARATANVTANATLEPANSLDTLGEVTVPANTQVQLAAANSGRKALRLAIKSTEPGGIYFGDATVDDGLGGWLEPGQIDYPDIESAVYAFNPSASDDVVVTVLDLERV